MNSVNLVGRVASEYQQTKSESLGIMFTMATRNHNGTSTFIGCEAWGKIAEMICSYVRKGDRLALSGSLVSSRYEKNGRAHYSTRVRVDKIYFIQDKKDKRDDDSLVDEQTQHYDFQENF